MAADEPPYLTIGTDVSAKYKGAFCEAKVKKVNRVVKCKVTFKNNLGTFMVTDDQIKGHLRLGAYIDAKHPEKNQYLEAVINKLQDYSQYTVVFDDGDETTLRRTSLCLKSGRHFAESPTLDQFPLTNPEHFGTPVIGSSKFKRKRRSTMNSSIDYESSDDESVPRRVKAIRGKEQNPDLGRVVCVDFGDRRKKENWYPGLIYPQPPHSPIKIAKEEHLVRSFKDGKYYQVPKRDIREFMKESIQKVENNSLRIAIEKATNYLEKDELPPNWDKALFASLDALSGEEDSQETDSDTSDDEPSEEKDRFVAQLYKFMDERGTPINKAPTVSNRDLNLYKLFKIMHKLGGYNKVTNKNKWKMVYCKMGLPQANANGPNQIKVAYKRYLQSFEDFYRKLGCTMVSNSRSTRGRHRSDRNIIVTRTRERETASPKSRGAKEAKEKAPATEKTKPEETKPKPPKPEETTPQKSEENKPGKSKPPEDSKPKRGTPEEKPRLVRQTSKDRKAPTERARTREDARREKVDSPSSSEKKTRSSLKKEEVSSKKEVETKQLPPPKEPPTKKEEKQPSPVKVVKKEEKSSSRERKPTVKKEAKKEEESPQRRKEQRRTQSEEKKPPAEKDEQQPEVVKSLSVKEERPARSDSVSKKEEQQQKEAVKSRTKKEVPVLPPPPPEVADAPPEEDPSSRDSFERKPPPGAPKEGEEPPGKAKKRSLKPDEKDEKESIAGMSDSDESCTNDSEKNFNKELKHNEIEIGDRVKVKYGRGRLQKVYEAKVLKIETDGTEKRFYVHYAGWNTRYDEWVKKNYIVAIINSTKQKSDGTTLKTSSSSMSLKKIDRGRPPGVLANTKPDRKNSTSSGSSSRATRSERKIPLSGGLEAKRRTRRKSGTATSATDASQESDTDAMDDDMSSSFKEELFSDDEEKDKMEDAKRSDITELEKAITVEEDGVKVEKEPVKQEVDDIKINEKPCSRKEDVDGSKVVPSTALPEKNPTKASESAALSKPTSSADGSGSLGRSLSRTSVAEKAALSFEGLIKKSKEIISPQKSSGTKEEKSVALSKESEKGSLKTDPISASAHQTVSIFGSVVSSFQKAAIPSVGNEPRTNTKDVGNLFKPIIKPEVEDKLKKLTQSELQSRANLHNQSQDIKVSSASASFSTLSLPSISKISEIKTETKSPLGDLMSLATFGDIKCPKTSDDVKSPAKLGDSKGWLGNAKCVTKLDDNKIPAKLSDVKGSQRLSDAKAAVRLGESKSSRLGDTKSATKLGDSKSAAKLGDTKSAAKSDDTKSPARSGDTKVPAKLVNTKNLGKLGDAKGSAKLDDTKSPAKLVGTKSLTVDKCSAKFNEAIVNITFGDNKSTARISDTKSQTSLGDSKDSAKLGDEKSPARSSDIKSVSKFAETKTTTKLGDNSTVKVSDTIISDVKSFTNLTEEKASSQFDKYLSPSKLSDMTRVKLSGVGNMHSPAKTSEVNSSAKLNTSDLPSKLSDSSSKQSDIKPPVLKELKSSKPSNTIPSVKSSDSTTSDKVSLNTIKLSDVKKEDSETKPKDSFDLLLESGPTYCHNPTKITDVFNFTFGSQSTSKESNITDSTFTKFTASDSLCRITPKSSETVDVSKMIPGILERLKKDEVSDSKLLDSPPPPKEELSFDFLRGSQTSSKSLSRSDSSNSLRICESDTNDSNLELKDVATCSKLEPSNITSESSQKLETKTDAKKVMEPTSDLNLSSSSSNSSYSNVLKDTSKTIGQQASVITVTTTKKETVLAPEKDKILPVKEASNVLTPAKQSATVNEDTSSKPEDSLKSEDSLFSKASSSLESFSVFGSNVEQDKTKESPSPTVRSESKESLFDEIKCSIEAAKSTSKYEQSSVIKFVSDAVETVRPENTQVKEPSDISSVKEQEAVSSKTTSDDQDISVPDSSQAVAKDSPCSSLVVHEKELGAEANITAPEESSFSQLNKKDLKRKKLGKKNPKKLGETSEGKDSKMKEGKMKSKKRLRLEEGDKSKAMSKSKKIKKNKKRFSRHEDSFGKFDFDDKIKKRKKKFLKSKEELKKKNKKKGSSKKKRKFEETDSEKETSMKKRKKKKLRVKEEEECSSSDEEEGDFFKEKPSSFMRQESSKSDDPDMSFLLCEEKVPASPGGDMPEDSSAGGSSEDEDEPCSSSRRRKHSVLDNTPPTTPSSTESLLSSSSPSHHDMEEINSMEGDELFPCSVGRGSEEYSAATTLAFAVCKNPTPKKKMRGQQRPSYTKHTRTPKVESYCEDSSGTSPATSSSPPYSNLSSSLSFSRSSIAHHPSSRYFYVPLQEKDPEKRISVLQDKMAALRKRYLALRAEVVAIDHKRRRARKKVRESGGGGGAANPSTQSEDGHSCS